MVSNDVFLYKISKEYVVPNMLDLRCAKLKIEHKNGKVKPGLLFTVIIGRKT